MAPAHQRFRLVPARLRWVCSPDSLRFDCSEEMQPLSTFVGQNRALKALEFWLELDKPGYNLFVTGLTGTGKTSTIQLGGVNQKIDLASVSVEARGFRRCRNVLLWHSG